MASRKGHTRPLSELSVREILPTPSFDFSQSKGESLVNGLIKLWEKILEIQGAKEQRSDHEAQIASVSNSGENIAEWIETQLKYIGRILCREKQQRSESLGKAGIQVEQTGSTACVDDGLDTVEQTGSTVCVDDGLDTVPVKLEKDTQTSKINFSTSSEPEVTNVPKNQRPSVKIDSVVSKHCLENKCLSDSQSLKLASSSHYHFNYSDVPFVVGMAPTASHSVIANLQMLIAVMKRHTRALCIPQQSDKSLSREATRPSSLPVAMQLQCLKSALKHLIQGLSELAMKQETLLFNLKFSKKLNPDDEMYQEYKEVSKSMVSAAEELAELHRLIKKLEASTLDKPVQPPAAKIVRQTKTTTRSGHVRKTTNQKMMEAIRHTKKALNPDILN